MLKKVPGEVALAAAIPGEHVGLRDAQLPGAVTKLGTGLADVEVADLQSSLSASGPCICPIACVHEVAEALDVQCDSLAVG